MELVLKQRSYKTISKFIFVVKHKDGSYSKVTCKRDYSGVSTSIMATDAVAQAMHLNFKQYKKNKITRVYYLNRAYNRVESLAVMA